MIAARRFEDWPARLDRFIAERRSLPYAYGTNDCGVWVLDWARLATGVELMPGFVAPASARGYKRLLASRGHTGVEGLALEVLGLPLSSARRAGRGDVVSFEIDRPEDGIGGAGERHLAIVTGVVAASPGLRGIVWVPRSLWKLGWKI